MILMQVSILTDPRCRHIAEAHARYLASKYGASVDVLYIGSDGKGDERIDAMREEWSKLRLASGSATRFNDPERVVRRIVFTAKSEDPRARATYVLLARQAESKAVLIGNIQKVAAPGRPRVMSNVAPTITTLEVPKTGIVVHQGPELSDLCSKIVQSFLARGVADHLCIRNLGVDHPAFDTLRQWRRLGAYGSIEPKIRWWASLLDPDTGERIDKHSGKTRANLRKLDRRLVKAFDGDVELECITRPVQVEDFLRDATGIIRSTYQASLGIGLKDTDRDRVFLREMAEAGKLRGYVMRGKGVPVAHVVGDRWGTAFTLWGTSFLPEHRKLAPGIVTLRRVMDSLATEGVAKFDFGWGEAEYKKKLGDHYTDEADISLYPKRLLPTLTFMAHRTFQSAKAQTERIIDRYGVRDRLKRVWRKPLVRSLGPAETRDR
jgi:hypothetical protein